MVTVVQKYESVLEYCINPQGMSVTERCLPYTSVCPREEPPLQGCAFKRGLHLREVNIVQGDWLNEVSVLVVSVLVVSVSEKCLS